MVRCCTCLWRFFCGQSVGFSTIICLKKRYLYREHTIQVSKADDTSIGSVRYKYRFLQEMDSPQRPTVTLERRGMEAGRCVFRLLSGDDFYFCMSLIRREYQRCVSSGIGPVDSDFLDGVSLSRTFDAEGSLLVT